MFLFDRSFLTSLVDGRKTLSVAHFQFVRFPLIIHFSSQYVMFCVILNTVGEEIFATTFVNILGKVSIVY